MRDAQGYLQPTIAFSRVRMCPLSAPAQPKHTQTASNVCEQPNHATQAGAYKARRRAGAIDTQRARQSGERSRHVASRPDQRVRRCPRSHCRQNRPQNRPACCYLPIQVVNQHVEEQLPDERDRQPAAERAWIVNSWDSRNAQAARAELFEPIRGNLDQHAISGVLQASRDEWHNICRSARQNRELLGVRQLRGGRRRTPTRKWPIVCSGRPLRRCEGSHGRPFQAQNFVSLPGDQAKSRR